MSLAKLEPLGEVVRLRQEMDRLFGRLFSQGMLWGETAPMLGGHWVPSVDVREENGNLIVEADLPGIPKENVEVTALEDGLIIEGKTREEKKEKGNGYYQCERHSGAFLRTIALPAKVDATKAQATFQDGTVTITLPKIAEASQGQKIKLQ